MGTGSGKTFIAVMLIKHMQGRRFGAVCRVTTGLPTRRGTTPFDGAYI